MKYRVIKAIIVFAILAHITSCVVVKTDNRRPDRYHYRRGGRYW